MQIILMLSEIRKPKLDQFPNQLFVFLSVVWKIALALFSLTNIYIYIFQTHCMMYYHILQ